MRVAKGLAPVDITLNCGKFAALLYIEFQKRGNTHVDTLLWVKNVSIMMIVNKK